MRIALALAGLALVLATVADVLLTTIMSRGTSLFSNRLASVLWRGLAAGRPGSRERDARLAQGGILALVAVVGLWVLLIWLGWALIFCGAPAALLNAQTLQPATLLDRVYFTGYTFVTLGLGDYQPQGALWKMATVLCAFNGLFLITFVITYLAPVFQAATDRRALATHLSGLGRSREEMLRTTWNGKDFGALEAHLVPLTSDIATLAQRHRTYPVLHYFRGTGRHEALAPGVAALDEALTVIECGCEGTPVREGILQPARRAIGEVLATLDARQVELEDPPPPLPDLDALLKDGLPTKDQAAFRRDAEAYAERRALLLAMVRSEGWSWDDVAETNAAGPRARSARSNAPA